MRRLFLFVATCILIISLLFLCFGGKDEAKGAGGAPIVGKAARPDPAGKAARPDHVVDPHLLDEVRDIIDGFTDEIIVDGHIDDLEYQAIINEINERLANEAKAIASEHHRTQWRAVAETIQHSGMEGAVRTELVQNVIKYPLTARMPPTAAITRGGLANWQHARKIFLRMVR